MGDTRLNAVLRGLDFIFKIVHPQDNFVLFGCDAIQCFTDVAAVTTDPARARALMYAEQLGYRYRHHISAAGWRRGVSLQPQDVIDAAIGVFCLDRLGLASGLRAELHAAVADARHLTAADYFGFDPRSEDPPPTAHEICPKCGRGSGASRKTDLCPCGEKLAVLGTYRVLSNALIHAHFFERVGLRPAGVAFTDVLGRLRAVRPYKAFAELPTEDFVDECYLATHVVFTLNNWGELSLPRRLVAHEHALLAGCLATHVARGDIHLAGECADALRSMGEEEDAADMRAALRFALGAQMPDGSWDGFAGRDPYTTYHATMVGVQCLLAHRPVGVGPGFPAAAGVLETMLRADVAAWRRGQRRTRAAEGTGAGEEKAAEDKRGADEADGSGAGAEAER